jgi:hypothetical protein
MRLCAAESFLSMSGNWAVENPDAPCDAPCSGWDVVTADAIGGPLALRHASKRSSGTWGPDDYDVSHDGRDIGRIFMPRAEVPADYPWMWTMTGAVVMPHFPSHGFCASLEEAKAKFAETWRAWLVGAQSNLLAHSEQFRDRPRT